MAGAALFAFGSARADEYGVQERPLGPEDVAPLAHLFAHIHGRFPGQVLKVEMERREFSGKPLWVYEIKLLTPDGDVIKLYYDARDLRLVQRRGHGRYAEGRVAESQHGEDEDQDEGAARPREDE